MILAIDDEAYASAYVEELQWAGFRVEVCRNVDDAAAFIETNGESIDMCIVDLMLPPGRLFGNEDTSFGRRTGFRFLEYLRKRYPDLPIMILTNVNSADVDATCENDSRCWCFRKFEVLPYEVVSQVEEIIGKQQGGDAGNE